MASYGDVELAHHLRRVEGFKETRQHDLRNFDDAVRRHCINRPHNEDTNIVAMPQIGTRVSLKEFEQFIAQPENANRDLE